jgi:hypothetical protein
MNVGLPGIGIGALFYLLLVFVMPFRELWKGLRGAPGPRQWPFIARQWAMAGAMGILMWFEGRWIVGLIRLLVRRGHPAAPGGGHWVAAATASDRANHLLPSLIGSAMVMATLLILVHASALIEGRNRPARQIF